LTGDEAPRATVVAGSDDLDVLEHRLGITTEGGGEDGEDNETPPWTQRLPVIRGSIGIAQPGLSARRLQQELLATPETPGAHGLRQLFSVLLDTAVSDGAELYLLVSE
jgi:hypothetical protein